VGIATLNKNKKQINPILNQLGRIPNDPNTTMEGKTFSGKAILLTLPRKTHKINTIELYMTI
jgi:hypothetical protein